MTSEEKQECNAPPRLPRLPSYLHQFVQKYPKYAPIDEHAMIGNMFTCALVTVDACIDWFCYPFFDSPSIFGVILDANKGGFFRISVGLPAYRISDEMVKHKQMYVPGTNVLISRVLSENGVSQISDFMVVRDPDTPVSRKTCAGKCKEQGWILREVEVIRGRSYFQVECCPAFNYARDSHRVEILTHGARFNCESMKLKMVISSTTALTWRPHPTFSGGVIAEFSLCEGEKQVFVFRESFSGRKDNPFKHEEFPDKTGHPVSLGEAARLKERTLNFWRKWISKCHYTGRWREIVHRSALALKLLIFEPTGAILAAPTCSLPEYVGGTRNWDYRFMWIRDSSFTLYALLKLGFTEEARAFMDFIIDRCNELEGDFGKLQIMYSIHGHANLDEIVLDHWEGYKGSSPVRIGNGAFHQLQLDIYGELMDTIYLADKYSRPVSYEIWIMLRKLVDWVCDNWNQKDEGIWEVRGGRQHFTYSKVLLWVAIDRGIRLAEKRSLPADIHRWRTIRDEICEFIHSRCWNSKRNCFMQVMRNAEDDHNPSTLDASVLIMPLMLFSSPVDPKILSTIEQICKPVREGGLMSNSLVYRYDVNQTDDGVSGEEGTFSICTFWLAEAMARAGSFEHKYLEQARWTFEQMIGYANHVGLFSEEIGLTGEALGNFPQAFSHLSLISAAIAINRGYDRRNHHD